MTSASTARSHLLGLIGSDTSLSRTPLMHGAEGLAQGHATVHRRIDTATPALADAPLAELLEAAVQLGFDGLNITHPGTAFDTACLTPGRWVGGVVYMPVETQLLREARQIGCATLDGTRMAVHQAVDAFELFTGRPGDAGRMRETLLSLG